MQITVNDITINYEDKGKGNIPIIFIHGFPFNKSMWQPQLDYFMKENRVITYDIRGFGQSTFGATQHSIAQYADDLILMMNELRIEKAIVCGLSMGGYILLNAVIRYPEKFAGIVLADTQCLADSTFAKEKRFKTMEQIETGGLFDFANGFVENVFRKETLNDNKELVEKIKSIILSTSSTTIVAALNALATREETCGNLNIISTPTLILCGKDDMLTPLDKSEFMKTNIESASLQIIHDAAHLSNLEQPDSFNQHVSNFISKIK
jgi:pimeloyl-ACP methyl ester carboxylesterase